VICGGPVLVEYMHGKVTWCVEILCYREFSYLVAFSLA